MFCVKCGRQLPDDAKFCVACGNKVEIPFNTSKVSDNQTEIASEKKGSVHEGDTLRQNNIVQNKAGLNKNKTKWFGIGLIAIVTVIIVFVAVQMITKEVDPEVISGVEERAIEQLAEDSYPEIVAQLEEIYPACTWNVGQPNNSSEMKSPKELGANNSIYKVTDHIDIMLYGNTGESVGATSATLYSDLKLTNRKGGYSLFNQRVEVSQTPYMFDDYDYSGSEEDSTSMATESNSDKGYSSGSNSNDSGYQSNVSSTSEVPYYENPTLLRMTGTWVSSTMGEDDVLFIGGGSEFGANVQNVILGEVFFNGYINEQSEIGDDVITFYSDYDDYGDSYEVTLVYDSEQDVVLLYLGGYENGAYLRAG